MKTPKFSLFTNVCYVGLLVLLMGMIACDVPPSAEPTKEAATEASSASGTVRARGRIAVNPPFDLTDVIRNAHYAFREDEERGGYSGGHANYGIHLTEAGWIELTPVAPADPGKRQSPESLIGPPLLLRTTSLNWGEGNQAEAPGRPVVAENGRLATVRGETTEWLENGPSGVEQSWTFSSLCSPLDDLEIRLQVAGLAYAGRTEAGLHFRDPESGLGFRYGRALWLDSRGETVRAELAYERGDILIRVPEAVLGETVFPATLDPTITPEFGIDEPILNSTSFSAYHPNVAFDGENYFVIWEDPRNREEFYDCLVGARVSPEGQVLDPTGLTLLCGMDFYYASIDFDGENYQIVWEAGLIYGMRVTPSGEVLDPGGFVIRRGDYPLNFAEVACGDDHSLAVWSFHHQGAAQDYGIHASRLARDGSVMDDPPILVDTGEELYANPVAAYDGQNYFLAWYDYRQGYEPEYKCNVYGARVSPEGQVLDAVPIDLSPVGDYQAYPRVAFDGENFLVAYNDCRDNGRPELRWSIYAVLVTPAGELLNPAGFLVATGESSVTINEVEYFNGYYYAFWSDDQVGRDSDIFITRIAPDGRVLDTQSLSGAGDGQFLLKAATGDGQMLAVWIDGREMRNAWNIYGARFDETGSIIDPEGFLITRSANREQHPAAAFDGVNYLVVWEDFRFFDTLDTYSDLFGARVTPDGEVLDPLGIPISTAPGIQANPDVAYTGEQFVVAWEDYRNGDGDDAVQDVYAARVSGAGTGLDPEGLPITTDEPEALEPVIAGDGTNAMLAWATYGACWAKRLSPAGTILDPDGLRLDPGWEYWFSGTPTIAFDGANYLIAWTYYYYEFTGQLFIYATRISPAGEILEAEPIRVAQIDWDWNEVHPASSYNGENYLVIWTSQYLGWHYIHGARLSSAGEVLDPEPLLILESAYQVADVRIAFDGSTWFLVWTDYRHGEEGEVFGMRIDGSGAVLDPDGLVVASFAGGAGRADIASDQAGQALVVYSHFVDEPDCLAERVRGRFIQTDNDNGRPCSSPAECDSGFCVDGVCCDEACGNSTDDCFGCSQAAGATQDGTCETLPADHVCRPAAGLCDYPETCDGLSDQCPADLLYQANHECRRPAGACDLTEYCTGESTACPADARQPADYPCRPARSPCDLAETCDGVEVDCPADQFVTTHLECRTAAGPCDQPEYCDGESAWCPADVYYGANRVCRPAAGYCDQSELCAGGTTECPADLHRADGTFCDDGLFCTGDDSCRDGECAVHQGDPCGDDGLFCNGQEYCAEENDRCRHTGDPCAVNQECSESLDECLSADDEDDDDNDDDDDDASPNGDGDDDESPSEQAGEADDDDGERGCGDIF